MEKKIHKDNSYVPSFSCLRGARIKGENDEDLCDHHHLLFFTRMMRMRK
jgi:hypothetical protein